jgi:hypothetical protein
MREAINDQFSCMESAVRFEPTVSIRFLAEELRRYGIKTNTKNDKGKTVFFQSAHIVLTYNKNGEDGLVYPSYSLVSFKDLFKIIGKNDDGCDDQDIVRVWYICEKLEKRRILQIQGTGTELLGEDDRPNLPDVYANLHHIHRNDIERDSYIYKSKFATNKAYTTTDGKTLIGIADYFLLG